MRSHTWDWEKRLHPRALELIERHALTEHPEGGWYRETHRSPLMIRTDFGERPAATTILYLLTNETFSAFHRLRQEEVWHFYEGDPLELDRIFESGSHSVIRLDTNTPHVVVSERTLQAACTTGRYSLCGCTVAPAFEFEDLELPTRDTLLREYPQHEDLIRRFTR